MKWLSGGLTLVNVATVCALLLGTLAGGLGKWIALFSIALGIAAAALAFCATRADAIPASDAARSFDPAQLWFWMVAACFAFFAFRSFCWLLYEDGNTLKVQSANNLGDLALHLTYIRNFASGVPLWPENPIHLFSQMRYPAGTDLFNALLLLAGFDLRRGLIWAGLLGALATFYALYRWSGAFGIAAFLFNGGLAGLQIVQTFEFVDYQGVKEIAWKSLPLSMLVTQRGLLYALPAGLLLLYQWRAKFFAGAGVADPGRVAASPAGRDQRSRLQPLPFWLELMLYATMPLFHMHTFIALSLVAAVLCVTGDARARRQLVWLVGAAFVPATFFVWTITDHLRARSLLAWKPGWVRGTGDFQQGFIEFWLVNFGITIPLVILLLGTLGYRAWTAARPHQLVSRPPPRAEMRETPAIILSAMRSSSPIVFVSAAIVLFLLACLVKTAPWEWDNIKLIIWAYLIVLPFLWSELIARWQTPIRVGVCIALFGSGFVSLFGGLLGGEPGYALADRAELDAVGTVARKLPVAARFAAFPTYNHPLLLQGRRVVLGYPGHLWTQGFDYAATEAKLTALMNGAPAWKQHARDVRARYLFWGREENEHYGASTRPWEQEASLVASGAWGAIYDLGAGRSSPDRPRQ